MSKPGSIVPCGFCFLSCLARGAGADPKGTVQLVPDRAGPYVAGTSVNVDVWLHSHLAYDTSIALIQFDFSASDPALSAGPTFMFDLTSLAYSEYYARQPELPVPWIWNPIACFCPSFFLTLPAGGALHVGRVHVQLPAGLGVYRLDLLNAAEPSPQVEVVGGLIEDWEELWEASTGEIGGGTLDLVVSVPIPALSDFGLAAFTVLLLAVGGYVILARARQPWANQTGARDVVRRP